MSTSGSRPKIPWSSKSPRDTLPAGSDTPAIAIVRIPHISNFTDFDALKAVKGLQVSFIENPVELDRFTAVILPGSKNTRFDLDWLHNTGWSRKLNAYGEAGGHILGVCGGYQMMGTSVQDPGGLEGQPGETPGLGLLPVETVLKAPKTTTLSGFSWEGEAGGGYEIHMGTTERLGGRALFEIISKNGAPAEGQDGCVAGDGRYMGTYMHGLFDTAGITRRWLASVGLGHLTVGSDCGLPARQAEYAKLAAHFSEHIDMPKIQKLISGEGS